MRSVPHEIELFCRSDGAGVATGGLCGIWLLGMDADAGGMSGWYQVPSAWPGPERQGTIKVQEACAFDLYAVFMS